MTGRFTSASPVSQPNPYSDYLRLDELLQLQHPRSQPASATAERFFIVGHQASELWLKAVIEAVEAAENKLVVEAPKASEALADVRRAGAATEALRNSLRTLRALTSREFLAFRPLLGDASGAQSCQFARLDSMLEHSGEGSLETAFIDALRRDTGLGLEELFADPQPSVWSSLAEAMLDLSEGLWQWRVDHLELAHRLIGDRGGTGGTAGTRYLTDSLMCRSFPELWAAWSGQTRHYRPTTHRDR